MSRDVRGRALDNRFLERLWRSVNHEDIYVRDYEWVLDLKSGLRSDFWFYDDERPQQSADDRTSGEIKSG